jgi:hypothetical protein
MWLLSPPLRLSPLESTNAIDTSPTREPPLSHPLFPCCQPISPYCPRKLLVRRGLWRRLCCCHEGQVHPRTTRTCSSAEICRRSPATGRRRSRTRWKMGPQDSGPTRPCRPGSAIEDEELMLQRRTPPVEVPPPATKRPRPPQVLFTNYVNVNLFLKIYNVLTIVHKIKIIYIPATTLFSHFCLW